MLLFNISHFKEMLIKLEKTEELNPKAQVL